MGSKNILKKCSKIIVVPMIIIFFAGSAFAGPSEYGSNYNEKNSDGHTQRITNEQHQNGDKRNSDVRGHDVSRSNDNNNGRRIVSGRVFDNSQHSKDYKNMPNRNYKNNQENYYRNVTREQYRNVPAQVIYTQRPYYERNRESNNNTAEILGAVAIGIILGTVLNSVSTNGNSVQYN